MNYRVLIIDADASPAEQLAETLRREGYWVDLAADGVAGLARATSHRFDLIILEASLPGRNGFEVCRILRYCGSLAAIMFLSSRDQLQDRVLGLKLGGDDYLPKSCETAELLARMQALLRRCSRENFRPAFRFGAVAVDFDQNRLHKAGARIDIASKELELLRYLILHRGQVVSRDELLEAVWQYQPGVSSRTVDVHVASLRQKLEDCPQEPRHIRTVRGMGYRFAS